NGLTRRELLARTACGFGSLALAGLCAQQSQAEMVNPLAAKAPHLAPRAKRVIFVFMQGGPSQVDTFDPKPKLTRDDRKKVPFLNARTRQTADQTLMKSPWQFQQYGESGTWVS